MKEKTSNSQKLLNYLDKLPGFCQDFLLGRKSEREINTRISYANDLTHFFAFILDTHPYFCDKKITDLVASDMAHITALDIDKYLEILADNHGEKSLARKKSSLSALYRYLHNTLQAVPTNPVLGAQKIKIHEKDFVIYLDLEEQERLLNTIRYGSGLTKRQQAWNKRTVKRDLAITMFFLDTGVRVSELHGCDEGDLDLDNKNVIITRKGGKQQLIYFSDECAQLFQDYLAEKALNPANPTGPKAPLFISSQKNRLSVRQLEEIIPKYVETALPERGRLNCHKLRSSFAMEFYGRPAEYGGRNILELQQRMGHKSIQSTNVYAKALANVSKETRNWREAAKSSIN